MIYTHFIGRIGQDAKTIIGTRGNFISIDLAVENYAKGEHITTWIRVRSNKTNHIALAQYLTKGRLILVEGSLNEPAIWTDKNNAGHVQLSVTADSINFVNTAKRRNESEGQAELAETTTTNSSAEEMPFGAPADTKEDLPF